MEAETVCLPGWQFLEAVTAKSLLLTSPSRVPHHVGILALELLHGALVSQGQEVSDESPRARDTIRSWQLQGFLAFISCHASTAIFQMMEARPRQKRLPGDQSLPTWTPLTFTIRCIDGGRGQARGFPVHHRMLNSIADVQDISPVMTTTNISRICQLLPAGQNHICPRNTALSQASNEQQRGTHHQLSCLTSHSPLRPTGHEAPTGQGRCLPCHLGFEKKTRDNF